MASDGSLTGSDVRQAVFAKAILGKPGYHTEQVDAFLARVADTLDGFGSLTANDVQDVVFKPQHWPRPGYREAEVDALLDEVVWILRRRSGAPPRSEPISGYHLRQTVLKRLRIGEGYRRSSVDAFVDRAANALDGFGPSMTPAEVQKVRFPSASRWQRGYSELEVQALLYRIVGELRRRSAGW